MVEKREGLCEGCGKYSDSLRQIESAQWMCRSCLCDIRGLKPRPPTPRQLLYARKLGFDVPEKMTFDEISERLDYFQQIQWYLFDVWQELTGERPKDSEIPTAEMNRLIRDIILKDRKHTLDIVSAQNARDDVFYGDNGQAQGQCNHGAPLPKPPVVRDRVFDFSANLLSRTFAKYAKCSGWRRW